MKKITKDLNTLARQLNRLSKKTAIMAAALGKTPIAAIPKKKGVPVTKKMAAPKGKILTPTEQVLTLMKRYKKGITVESLRGKAGYTEKQISNIVHRACKKGKMKRIGRGIYSVHGL